jgi:hypothetical protein
MSEHAFSNDALQTFQEYWERRFEAQEKLVTTNFDLRDRALKIQHDAAAQALHLATSTLENRLTQLNELRSEVTQDRGNFITRVEYEGSDKESNRRLTALENWQARLIGISIVLVLLSGFIGAAIMRLFSR